MRVEMPEVMTILCYKPLDECRASPLEYAPKPYKEGI